MDLGRVPIHVPTTDCYYPFARLRLRKRTPSVVVTACSTAVPTVQRCVGWSTVSAYMNGGLSLNRGSSRALFETEGSKGRMGKKWKVESEVK